MTVTRFQILDTRESFVGRSRTMKIKIGQLQTRAMFVPSTFNEEQNTVELVWTTGARGKRMTWDGDVYYEELEVSESACDLSRLNNKAPVLNTHRAHALEFQLGVVERAWFVGNEGHAVVRFSKRPEVQGIRNDVRDGIITHTSVGYGDIKYKRLEETVEGAPIFRAVKWTPAEISLVPMGFDDKAVVRSNDQEVFEVEVDEVQTRGMAPQNGEQQMTEEEIKRAAELKAQDEAKRAAEAAAAAKAVQDERARISGITDAVRTAGLSEDFGATLVKDGTSLDKAREMVLEEMKKRSDSIETENHVRASVGEEAREKRILAASAALLFRAGIQLKDAPKDNGGEFRGMSLLRLAEDFLHAAGVKTRGLSPMEIAAKAFTYRAGGYATTSDFAVLLETTMNKVLLGSYQLADLTWRRFCGVKTVSDFRAHNFYRTGSFGVLDSLNENGEYKRKSIPDGTKVSISAATYGNTIALSRKTIINDDMGALTGLLQELGLAAGLTIEEAVFDMLTDNSGLGPTMSNSQPFFHSSRLNVNATGSTLTIEGIDADAAVMEAQKDTNNQRYINVRPKVLLVPRSLRGTALVVNDAEFNYDGEFQKPNTVRGMFSDVIATPRLTGTRRYLFADPSIIPAFVVSFLAGNQEPVLESQEGWSIDGTEMKVRFDFGLDPFDPKGAVTNSGTA